MRHFTKILISLLAVLFLALITMVSVSWLVYRTDRHAQQEPSDTQNTITTIPPTNNNILPDEPEHQPPTELPENEPTFPTAPTEPEIEVHTHFYQIDIIAPTCLDGGYSTYSCACGDKYVDSYTDAKGHTYIKTVIDATCIDRGLAIEMCKFCGYEVTTFTDEPLGHSWGVWETTKQSTIWTEGKQTRTCSTCYVSESKNIAIICGNSIKLSVTDQTICDVMSFPKEEDFGIYHKQAVILYYAILNRGADEYNKWPSGIYGPDHYVHLFLPIDRLSEMPREEQVVLSRDTTYWFASIFNQKVLHGIIWLGMDMYDQIDGGVSIHIDPTYTHDRIQQQIYDEAYRNANLLAGVYDGMFERDAIIAINKWICDNVSYERGQNALEVMQSGKAQCGGYASLFYQMCINAGIECEYIIGCIDGDMSCINCHAWNRVRIADTWYWIDVCWNDTERNRHSYLLADELWSPRILCNIETCGFTKLQ